jgi:hypothetical protein
VPTGLLLWIAAMSLTITGLISVLWYRVVFGGFLIISGLALGLWSGSFLD